MSTLDAGAEAKRIEGVDNQAGKGAEVAAATLRADYTNYLKEHGNDVAGAQEWLKATTDALAKAGVLPDITIGVVNNDSDVLGTGGKISKDDLTKDNFLLGGSTGANQSFDSVFTNMLVNNEGGLTTQVNDKLNVKDGGDYTKDAFSKFDDAQEKQAVTAAQQSILRTLDAGLFGTLPGKDVSILQYLDTAGGGSTPDGKIGMKDIDAALANPYTPPATLLALSALKGQMEEHGWDNRSVTDILKQDGIAIPDGAGSDWPGFYKAANSSFTKANTDYTDSIATTDPSQPVTDNSGGGGGGARHLS